MKDRGGAVCRGALWELESSEGRLPRQSAHQRPREGPSDAPSPRTQEVEDVITQGPPASGSCHLAASSPET